MSTQRREKGLLTQALQGNRDAFGDLYEMYMDEVYRYIYYRVSSEVDAEDLTELVFLKVWENLQTFEQKVSFRAWLLRFARNTVIDHYRTRKTHVALDEYVASASGHEQPEEKVRTQETAAKLMRAISKLSQLQQDVIILRFANGYSAMETAQILDRDVGTIRVLQHRALKSMQSFLVAEDIVHG
jgi:RNA polymerase sigma factor (sigma-70 family)